MPVPHHQVDDWFQSSLTFLRVLIRCDASHGPKRVNCVMPPVEPEMKPPLPQRRFDTAGMKKLHASFHISNRVSQVVRQASGTGSSSVCGSVSPRYSCNRA